jgi:uncharacterized protein YdcH (DUF465 family)
MGLKLELFSDSVEPVHCNKFIFTRGCFASMDTNLREIRERLIATDEEFSRLSREHASLDIRLDEFVKKSYLTESEEMEEINLKKRKLWLKDQMERILQNHKKALV